MSNLAIRDVEAFPLREPASGHRYTLLRLRTTSGLTGYVECARVTLPELEQARRILDSRPANAWAGLPAGTPMRGALCTALADLTAKACETPLFRLLGGPTRTKARAITSLEGSTDDQLAASLQAGMKAGFRAFGVPLSGLAAGGAAQAFVHAVRARVEKLRSAGGPGVDWVLYGDAALEPAQAGRLAADLEDLHLLWFDEPCGLHALAAVRRMAEETVTTLGFGRDVREVARFQALLREGLAGVLRPDISFHGIAGVRAIAALAETYYVAIAPHQNGGPVATAAAIHTAASVPNFFIQHVALPTDARDREMRRVLVREPVETAGEGFLALPSGAGLGITINPKALQQYEDTTP
jgi:galactonate dehydratase